MKEEKEIKKEKDKKEHTHNKIHELEEENKKLQEEVLRAKADLINYRKRKDEEVSAYLKYANSDLIYELLPVLDNFERAIKMDDNNLSDEVSKFLAGMKMMYAAFREMLEKEGLKEIEALGQKFDANYHDCLFTDNDPLYEDEIVLDVLQKGYMYKDKVLRCASVKVNKLNENKEEKEDKKGNDNNE